MSSLQTDNSFFQDKIALRLNHLPDGDISVLDAFHGQGSIWRQIKKRCQDRKINLLGIDKKRAADFNLMGDNRKFLKSMELRRFNVIDLDAYGVPSEQIAIIFNRGWTGTCFVTFIQSVMGQMPRRLLYGVGFTKRMIDKCPTLFGIRGWGYFRGWLYSLGVRQIAHRWIGRTHYWVFEIK